MDHLKQLKIQLKNQTFWIVVLVTLSQGAAVILLAQITTNVAVHAVVIVPISLIISYLVVNLMAEKATDPIKNLRQAILHVSPNGHNTPAPNLDKIQLGRELVTALSLEVYQLASQHPTPNNSNNSLQKSALDHFPLPCLIMDRHGTIKAVSQVTYKYLSLADDEVIGQKLSDLLELKSDSTPVEDWMESAQKKSVNSTLSLNKVKIRRKIANSPHHQADLSAYYNRHDPAGAEFILTLFDKSREYTESDANLNFVSLAVHELRTPLTVLKGYVEVFEEEIGPTLDGELKDFMNKLRVSTEQLSSFVSNILNVSRIDNDQLRLDLKSEDWANVLKSACSDSELRAKVHGKEISYDIAQNLPAVAVDRISIYEVLTNLLDNAIKYSGDNKSIVVKTYLGKDDRIITEVTDFGVGIPENVINNLFVKFYRNHRTKGAVSGTGLGLFLCKSIIDAHGGQIWASSREGKGSTFGFSLIPYQQLEEEKRSKQSDITITKHGWIKNHSLYRK